MLAVDAETAGVTFADAEHAARFVAAFAERFGRDSRYRVRLWAPDDDSSQWSASISGPWLSWYPDAETDMAPLMHWTSDGVLSH